MNKKQEWYLRTTQGDSFNKVGKKSGRDPSAIGRAAAKGWKLSAETVIAIAIAYNQNPIDALIACGFIPPNSATGITIPPLEAYSMEELCDELGKRIRRLGNQRSL